MPRTFVRKELWVINPTAIYKTKNPPKITFCSPSPVSPEAGSRRWDQESFKKFKIPESRPVLKVRAEKKMPVGTRSQSRQEDEVLYISSDSSVDMVLTEVKKKQPPELKKVGSEVKRRGRPRKVSEEESEENRESKKKKSKVKPKMKIKVENKSLMSRKTEGALPMQEGEIPITNKPGAEEEEREEFEKNMKHDINFVLAKHVVDKKVAFDVDKDKKATGFRKKMLEAIRRADILTLRESLDGGNVHIPNDVVKSSSAKSAPARKVPTPILLSNENSPDTSYEVTIDQDAPQMPVISLGEKKPRQNRPPVSKVEKVKSKVKIPLKPLNIFPSIKKTSFKIPRKEAEKVRKEKTPRWVVNGALWRWALGVDDNGQSCRVEKKVEKVPWAKKVQSRSCEEFQAWLVRGDFKEGDDCDWAEAARKEKLLNKWRRRGELEWRLKTSSQVLGRAQTGSADPLGLGVGASLAAPESPYWSEEEEEEGRGWSSPVRGEREELGGLESDSSGQSVVTHIRTPPHITVLEEEQEEEEEARTPERQQERPEEKLVNKIPTPPPSVVPPTKRLVLNLESGETGPGVETAGEGERSQVELSGLVRSDVKRLRLC